MKEHSWIIDLQVRYDNQGDAVNLRYGINAIDREIALVKAGQRLAKKMRGAKIQTASIIQEKTKKPKTINLPKKDFDGRNSRWADFEVK